MKILLKKNKLAKIVHNENNLGFVPTMGTIHKGHLSLIRRSILECDKTLVSIFINKPQFNKINDYLKYPRVLKSDIHKLKKLKIDYLYLPYEKEIYPNGPNKKIKVSNFKKKLCGKFRSGHFEAVIDVVDRFIKIIKPSKIYFGQKDYQQFILIKQFVKKNHKRIKVVKCKTIRENNGIAYSSRNSLLSSSEKEIASKIYKLVLINKKKIINNKKILKIIKSKIFNLGVKKVEYIELLNINKIINPYNKKKNYKVFFAYYLGSTRLIDNI
jgi:pantoate--beta-alanine ligase